MPRNELIDEASSRLTDYIRYLEAFLSADISKSEFIAVESKFRDWLDGYEWGEPRGEDRVARAAIAQLALVFGLADVGVTDRQHVLHTAKDVLSNIPVPRSFVAHFNGQLDAVAALWELNSSIFVGAQIAVVKRETPRESTRIKWGGDGMLPISVITIENVYHEKNLIDSLTTWGLTRQRAYDCRKKIQRGGVLITTVAINEAQYDAVRQAVSRNDGHILERHS